MAKQHQAGAYHRKILLRRQMLRFARDGAAYVPFIGDGDISVDVYGGRKVYGADMAQSRVELARSRIPDSEVLVADCNGWPFAGQKLERLALADFDPYRDPYKGFKSFWSAGPKLTNPFVCCFTDGQRQALMRVGTWSHPDGTAVEGTLNERRRIFHAYLSGQIWPWFEDFVKPWELAHRVRYMHGWMVYWVAVLRKPTTRFVSISGVARRSNGALTAAKRREVLELTANGMMLTSIAAALKVKRQTLTKLLDSDEKFAADFADAQERADEAVMEALFQAAVSGNIQAAAKWNEINPSRSSSRAVAVPAGTDESQRRQTRVERLNALAEGDPFDPETEIPEGYFPE